MTFQKSYGFHAFVTLHPGASAPAAGAKQGARAGAHSRCGLSATTRTHLPAKPVLADTLARAAESSAQTVASARRQAAGRVQISQAVRTIDEVARLNLVATREAEQAARNLDALGAELTQLGAR